VYGLRIAPAPPRSQRRFERRSALTRLGGEERGALSPALLAELFFVGMAAASDARLLEVCNLGTGHVVVVVVAEPLDDLEDPAAVRWYLRFGLSYRDVEELLAERGIEVDHVTVFRWVQRFTPSLVDAARPCRHAVGDRWFVDETYVKVAGRWPYVYRAVDQYGQIIDVYTSARRDTHAARRFFVTALGAHGEPTEVVTDRAWPLGAVIDELIPAAFHNTEQYANNRIEADHGLLKARLRPMRGLKRDDSARVIVRGHALMQNIRRGHYELGVDARSHRCVARAFGELARTI
jgi:IS6 family transposase